MNETHLKLLRAIEANPNASQRDLSEVLGVSLGKANYCLKALMEKGWVKAGNFKANPDKGKYLYLLTPQGLEAKASLTINFLRRKQAEYDLLKAEIASLEREVARPAPTRPMEPPP